MKAYRFRLEGVARIRGLQERLAAHTLAGATVILRRAERALVEARAALAALSPPSGSTTGAQVVWTQDQGERLDETRRRRAEAVAAASTAVDDARRAWGEARKRCAMLERLDARQREQWQVTFDRAETKELDDVATVAFVRSGGAR